MNELPFGGTSNGEGAIEGAPSEGSLSEADAPRTDFSDFSGSGFGSGKQQEGLRFGITRGADGRHLRSGKGDKGKAGGV